MNGPGAVWQQAADNFDRHLQAVTDEQWGAATNCGEWTVRELVDHAVHWQGMIAGVLGADVTPGASWDTVRPAIQGALSDPSSLEGNIEGGPFNGMPKHQALGTGVGDLLIHSWDLACAIGGDTTLPPEAVEAVHMGLQRMPPQMLRSETMFGPEVAVADDASAQDKLLAFVGRQP